MSMDCFVLRNKYACETSTQCGVDVNKANSYDQTALDIVNKFTTSRASKEIKQLLKEASFTVQAKAVKDHCNICDPNTLTFKEGDIIKIVEQKQDGVWKGSLMKEGRMAKAGFFPADHVVLIDDNVGRKNAFQINTNHVVTDTSDLIPQINGFHGNHRSLSHSSSYGSIGHDEAFPPPPSPVCEPRSLHNDTDATNQNITVLPPLPPPSYQAVVNSLPHNQNFGTSKVIVNHVGEHVYVDSYEPAYQNTAWDMRSASPGKDSPASSNRNSAASSDSGRGPSTNYLDPKVHHNYVNVHVNNHHRLSGTSYESSASSSRQSYHSTSSSSVGSLDRLEESGYSSQINVAELFQAGVPDHEVLRAWLSDLRYDEYYHNFMAAGYDMPTITHMTPQDLTAIGISKPGHRKKLKAEIARLNIHDGIPDFKPNDLYDWLRILHLEQYYNTLANQGYDNIDFVVDITWEDLEEIGIQKLGHQKKIMLAIDRMKRIMSGSKRLSSMDGRPESGEMLEPPMNSIRWSGERSSPPPPAPPIYNELPPYLKPPKRSSSGDSLSTNSSGEMRSLNQPLESEYANTSNQPKKQSVVPIQVKRSMSQSTPNGISDSKENVSHPKMCQSFHAPMDRSSDYSDRENTPTGDDLEMTRSPVNVMPVAPKAAVKPKPIAKIVAKAKNTSRECSPDIINIEKHEAERNNDDYKSPVKNLDGFKFPLATNGSLKRRTSDHIYDTPQLGSPRSTGAYVSYPPSSVHHPASAPHSPGTPVFVQTQFDHSQSGSPRSSQQSSPSGRVRRPPPPPPKRTHSIKTVETHAKDTGSENNNSPVAVVTSVSSVLSTPPPIQPKPAMATAQQQAFVNCVQGLSQRFGKQSEESSTTDNLSSDGEDLPPPPPPVAMDIITPKVHNYGLLGKSDKTSSGEYMLQQRLKREGTASVNSGNTGTCTGVESAFGVKLRQTDTPSQNQSADKTVTQSAVNTVTPNQSQSVDTSQHCVQDSGVAQSQVPQSCVQNSDGVRTEQNHTGSGDSARQSKDSGIDISASTTSLDSNTLPFANENVGTIKQRTPVAKPSLVMVMDDGSEPHGDEMFIENSDTMKRTPAKLPKPQQPNIQQLQQQQLQQQNHQINQQQQQQQSSTQQQHVHNQRDNNNSVPQNSNSQNRMASVGNGQTGHQQAQRVNKQSAQSSQPQNVQQQEVQKQQLQKQQQQQLQKQQQQQQLQKQQQQQLQKQHQQQQLIQQQQPSYSASVTASYAPNKTQTASADTKEARPSVPQKPSKPVTCPKPPVAGPGTTRSGDVLSEIDNMLQGLTDELDAMLDFELEEP